MKPIQADIFNLREPLPKITLRPYQQKAVDAVMWALDNNLLGGELLVLPTGSGKSVIIAELADRIGKRFGSDHGILILQPSKELLEQNYEKLSHYVTDDEIGIFSASMNEKTVGRVTLATIQSIYKKPHLFMRTKLVLLDECDLLDPRKDEAMFMRFLKAIGLPKVVGTTATPYRMAVGYKDGESGVMEPFATVKLINRLKGGFWQRILYNVTMEELMAGGYLCPLEYVDRDVVDQHAMMLNNAGTDFDMDSFSESMTTEQVKVVEAVGYGLSGSKSVLVFCPSVASAEELAKAVPGAEVVTSKTHPKERERIIGGFKSGKIRCVMNMGVLTTGFDHPSLDCIVLARPTRSVRLYQQMCGRGVRNAPGKTACKIIDVCGNVKNLGRIETFKVVKRHLWELESEKGSWHGRELYAGTGGNAKKKSNYDPNNLACLTCGTLLPEKGTPCSEGLVH